MRPLGNRDNLFKAYKPKSGNLYKAKGYKMKRIAFTLVALTILSMFEQTQAVTDVDFDWQENKEKMSTYMKSTTQDECPAFVFPSDKMKVRDEKPHKPLEYVNLSVDEQEKAMRVSSYIPNPLSPCSYIIDDNHSPNRKWNRKGWAACYYCCISEELTSIVKKFLVPYAAVWQLSGRCVCVENPFANQ